MNWNTNSRNGKQYGTSKKTNWEGGIFFLFNEEMGEKGLCLVVQTNDGVSVKFDRSFLSISIAFQSRMLSFSLMTNDFFF